MKHFFCCRTKFPACESCAQFDAECSASCPKCHVRNLRLQFAERLDHDPEIDTDGEEAIDPRRNCEDVRTDPPRFTPVARTFKMLPFLWKLKRSWYETDSKSCTGCSEPEPLCRALFNVVLIHDGKTQLYKHKLCGRCVACVSNRMVSIHAATLCEFFTYLKIEPAKLVAPGKLAEVSENVYVSSSGLKFHASWEHAYRVPYEGHGINVSPVTADEDVNESS